MRMNTEKPVIHLMYRGLFINGKLRAFEVKIGVGFPKSRLIRLIKLIGLIGKGL